MKPRILVVEDEGSISEPLQEALERDGFVAEVAPTIAEATARLRAEPVDLILLDVMLPDGDGRDFCREIRRTADTPIIMLTARGEEMDKVLALELGADDYVVKPFSSRELASRIRAILRRGSSKPARTTITIDAITLDRAARQVTKNGNVIEMTPREFDLLAFLMEHAGDVVRREEIMDEVWDPHWFGSTKTLDVHVSWVRKKIEDDPSRPMYLTTLRGVGFRFAAPERT